MNDLVKIFLYKLVNFTSFFALGTFIISIFTKLRGKIIDNNLLLSFMIMFTLVSCAIALGEVQRIKRDKIYDLENFEFSSKKVLIIVFCFAPLSVQIIYNFMQQRV